jgi:hypothetical protein
MRHGAIPAPRRDSTVSPVSPAAAAASAGLHAAVLTTPQQGRRILVANPTERGRVFSLAGVGVPSEPGRDALTRDPVLVRGVYVVIPAWTVVWFGRTRTH